MASAEYCRRQAKICFELATVATDPVETDRLVAMGQKFMRLAGEAEDDQGQASSDGKP